MIPYIYISVPRTATNSIHKALGSDNLNNHKSIRLIKDDEFSFGFIRNPYEQLKSWYDYHKKMPNLTQYKVKFNDWISSGCPHHWDEGMMKYTGVSHPCQQSDYLTDEAGKQLVDFIGIFEALESDWRHVCRKIDLDKDLEYLNYSKAPNNISAIGYYTKENIALVKTQFKPTFKLYRNVLTKPLR
jgi:hypothetical protein